MLRNRVAPAVLALSMAMAAAGCDGGGGASGDDTSPSPSTAPSASVSATPPATEAALPEPPKAADTTTGRKAFALHVVDAWGYALRTNDPDPLLKLSPKKELCDGCEQLASELRKRKKQGWYVDFPGVQVKKAQVEKAGGISVATMSVAIPSSDSYNDDGSYRSTNPEHAKGTFEVQMRFKTRPPRCIKSAGCSSQPKRSFELVSFRVG